MDSEAIIKAAVEAAEAQQKNGHQPQHPGIVPQPVPTSVQLSSSQDTNGNKFVILTLTTPTGQNFYFFDPETAEKIADGLKKMTSVANTGLVIPGLV